MPRSPEAGPERRPSLLHTPHLISPPGKKFLRELYMADFSRAVRDKDEEEIDELLERLAVLDALIDADDRAAEEGSQP